MKSLKLLLILCLISSSLMAQKGKVRGTIIDDKTGETLIGAYIIIDGTSDGTTTDLDGNYVLELQEGHYTLVFSSIGFQTLKIEDIIIKKGEVTILDVNLKTASVALEEIVVSAKATRRSEGALQTIQKKSPNLLDAISSELFSKIGDSNAADAVKRVSGVSIEGGKYVYVRGLGDRYIKTTLNGMTIPGLDPDKNTVQMDLFPTNLIDNIIVYKSFTPDLPGDFTGGLVDINLKDFPEQKTLNVNLGYSTTLNMNFNPNFIYKEGSLSESFGFADKSNKLAFNENTIIPDESSNDIALYQLSQKFSPELGVKHGASSFLNQKYGISFGNQYDKNNYSIGVTLAANYSNTYTYYDDIYQGIFFKESENSSITNLDKREVTTGTMGQNEILWSGLGGISLKTKAHKLTFSILHTQNGVGRAAEYSSQNFDETNATLYKNALDYSQKSVTNLLLGGTHNFNEKHLKIDWKISPTLSKILEPDVRSARLSYDTDTDSYALQLGDGAGIDRYFRSLDEFNLASVLNTTYKFKQWDKKSSKLKFGLSNTYKIRDYQILLYQFANTSNFNDFSEDLNQILKNENLWTPETETGMYVLGNRDLNNEYHATANIGAAYVMNELPLTDNLKTIYGVRVENARINYQGYYQNQRIDSLVHNETAILPSFNLVYKLIENMNLRASYTRTLARPSFKEKSNAHIDDPISQTVFIGNLNLVESNINNYDIRWEYFFKNKQMISVSTFFKDFKNPIEMVPFQLSPNNVQPKNINEAKIYGAELELKKRLTPSTANTNIDIAANFTALISQVDTKNVIVDNSGKTEYELRQENERDGEETSIMRPMQGQAPYIINATLNIAHNNLSANLSYNVQGKKLALVGSGIVPDVYEKSFHSLNFKAAYNFGKNERCKLSLSAKNILNGKFQQIYKSYNAPETFYRSYTRGQNIGLSFTYKFF